MSKINLKFVLIFLLLLAPLAQATNSQESASDNPLAFLKPLAGKKCAVHLKNGEVINGTLWVYGTDHVSVKVKKGLLYSKTEKYLASEIDFLKDEAANRYYMPTADRANEKPHTQPVNNPEPSIAKEEAELEQAFQGSFRFLSKEEKTIKNQSPPDPAPQMSFK